MIDIPTVKRHSVDGYGRQDICYNDPNGEFVYYDDYLALWQELKNLRAEAQRLKDTDQILRPVELPDIEENESAFKAGLNSLVDCLEDCGDAEQGLRLALRSIREKLQEVKP